MKVRVKNRSHAIKRRLVIKREAYYKHQICMFLLALLARKGCSVSFFFQSVHLPYLNKLCHFMTLRQCNTVVQKYSMS